MRALYLALAGLLVACGGDVVVDAPAVTGTGGSIGTGGNTGAGGVAGVGASTPDAGGLVVCAGVTCMPGQICCSPAGPSLVCFTGTGCPP